MQSDLFSSQELVEVFSGQLQKMSARSESSNGLIQYSLKELNVNELIGKQVKLSFSGEIHCIGCHAQIKKSFSQGYCYRCFTTKASCDACIMSPEKCHFEQNTCREPAWGERFCMQSHYVYLANSSGIKVGITRGTQVPTRWIDQGAVQAIPIFRVSNRHLSGLVEVVLKQHVADKTNWRSMLKGQPEMLDLTVIRGRLFDEIKSEITALQNHYGLSAIQSLWHSESFDFNYPVSAYPEKISSFNLDKEAEVEGTLMGIKGQYWILDSGVINIRRFTGYQVSLFAA